MDKISRIVREECDAKTASRIMKRLKPVIDELVAQGETARALGKRTGRRSRSRSWERPSSRAVVEDTSANGEPQIREHRFDSR